MVFLDGGSGREGECLFVFCYFCGVNFSCVMDRLFVFGLGGPEVIFIALVVLLLFGGKKIPELMKGLGKGVKSFKEGMNGKEEEKDAGEGK